MASKKKLEIPAFHLKKKPARLIVVSDESANKFIVETETEITIQLLSSKIVPLDFSLLFNNLQKGQTSYLYFWRANGMLADQLVGVSIKQS